MKTTIFVFSGTGNSLAVAKKISNVFGDTTLTSIAKYSDQQAIFTNDERVGFIFPCYYGELPQIVKNFVAKVKMDKAKYVFSIITAGGNIGYGFKILDKLLGEKGKTLNYGKSMVITSNYIVGWYYTMINANNEKLRRILKVSDKKIKQFALDIQEGKNHVDKESRIGYILPHIISPKKIIQDTRLWDIEFSAGEKCNGCGICEKVCPVKNIRLVDNKPEFTHNCQRCMACIQFCPQQAIQYKGKYINKTRYYHPDISINEISEFHK